eukprot:jgi/Bigna1/73932/fgenesh1_pg.26_\
MEEVVPELDATNNESAILREECMWYHLLSVSTFLDIAVILSNKNFESPSLPFFTIQSLNSSNLEYTGLPYGLSLPFRTAMYNTGASTYQEIIHAGASIAMPTGKRTIEPGITTPVKTIALGKVIIPNSPPVNIANVNAVIQIPKVRRKTPIKYINGDAKNTINGTDG